MSGTDALEVSLARLIADVKAGDWLDAVDEATWLAERIREGYDAPGAVQERLRDLLERVPLGQPLVAEHVRGVLNAFG
jgi:hypothetical protein